MIRGCVVVFVSIQLFKQVQIVNAFVESCNASLQTVENVTMCPSDKSAYEEAVQKKNCSSLAADANTCKSFQYHCVLSDDLKYIIEVCAPSIITIGYSCTKFSTSHKSIMRIEGFACNDSITECPFGYNSTEAYKYSLCYENVSRPLSTEIPPNVSKPLLTEVHPRIENSKTFDPWPIVLVVSVVLGTGSFLISFCVFMYKRRTRQRADPNPPELIELEIRVPAQNRNGQGENQDDIDGDHDNGEARGLLEDLHNQPNEGPAQNRNRQGENQDDIDGDHDNGEARSLPEDLQNQSHEGSSQTNGIPLSSNSLQSEAHLPNATITDTLLIYERTSEQLQPEEQNATNNGNLQTKDDAPSSIAPELQQTSSNEGTWHQASMKTTISATSETDQIMLKCAVNFLLRNLENPDESWTKGKIVSHVEKTIQQLINSNAEQLLISFIKRLDSNKKIAATLLKCGEEMFKHISSIQEKYVANKLKITHGCVCVTFCFADSRDLENYLEKVRIKDKHLITGLSKILLNETLLRIFDINPRVVTWKASELKVYQGSQLVKIETFLEPLTGSPKVFTGISEDLCRTEIMDDKPGPSNYPFFGLDKSSENYIRLCCLITTICGPLLRDILSRHIKSVNLRNELDINKGKLEKIMSKVQKDQFYLNAGSNPISPKDLDISVLYMLLRHICSNIPEPKTGWGNPPLKGDYSISACIERIRQIRNSISAHSTNVKVDDTDFQNYWDELENSIIETEKQLTGGDVYEDGINKIKTMKIPSVEEYKREFPPQEDLCRTEIMGDKPGPFNYPFFGLDKSSENYIRLCCLITTICGPLLRDILSRHIKSVNLRNELDINKGKLEKIMSKVQKEQFYLNAGSNPISPKDLDISVLYMLLRHICSNIPEPKTGWGNPPLKGDYSISACIERIRQIRNSICAHSTNVKVDDTDFQNYWDELENSIIETEKQLTGGDVYEDGINKIKTMKIPSVEEYKREFPPQEDLCRTEIMGDKPGPFNYPFFGLDKSSENYIRLCCLITTICGPLLRDILSRHIKSVNLRNELDINKGKLEKIMSKVQKEQFYLNAGSNPISPKDLDISVLYMLLRHICSNIPEPKTGWGNPPLKGDYSISACIERIRQIRNSICAHSTNVKVDDTDFQNYWDELENSIIETEKQLTGGDVYEDGINKIKTMKIPSVEEYKREFPPQEDLCRTEIMGDKPGPFNYPFFGLDKSSENYIRLCCLITTICGPLLRDILSRHIKSVNLRNELDINKGKLEKIMSKVQKEQFYLNAGSNPISPKDLDISVLYMLLRHICSNIPEPKTGWGNPPLKGDYSISACIERIRQIRNSICAHSTNVKVDDTDFQNYWDELENSIIETEKQLTGGDVYEDGINKIKTMKIPSVEEYKREFPPQEESSEESEDEKKCNMFRSKETSKYPGYMKYRTRAKSFNDCKVDWLKDKKEEFARYGFLYQGVDLKTTCFHCGFSKDDWTEKDNIFATHCFSEISCAYVQYLNMPIIDQYIPGMIYVNR
ncbi:uncharacterized protein [Magallana gigas]|uniref:uncharacterized protein isoform X4 n=1 Tax=Magallana gigas TaxID=29159 RepID=UPI0033413F2E